ncbi:hypothetical protein BpHYR1_004148 [Brachionus plicatilis]|uniref:Uncharacterized protein n=1 Tax=Brachionus plicatilis TaxID=10195 RepID=A0A3M7SXM6_BRAPC|nr:hypothetical protein BpHYR1_004148 [Brachionus plicatilis]
MDKSPNQIFTSSNYAPTETYLNMFLNEEFKQTPFKQLGTVAPKAILAVKSITLASGKQANVHYTYVNFPRSLNHLIQLVNTYDLDYAKLSIHIEKMNFNVHIGFSMVEI